MMNLEHYYADEEGWASGPHLFVADDEIWVFNPLDRRGTHSPSWNAVSWGVEVVGDYDVEPLSQAVKDNMVAALVGLHRLGQLDPSTLRLHKDDPRTTHRECPGKAIVKSEVIALVREALR